MTRVKRWMALILSILFVFQCGMTTTFANEEETSITMEIAFDSKTKEVIVYGVSTPVFSQDQVSIMVLDPLDNISYIHQQEITKDGNYEFKFKLDENTLEGRYVVRVGSTRTPMAKEGSFTYQIEGEKYVLTVSSTLGENNKIYVDGELLTLGGEVAGIYDFVYSMPADALEGTYEIIVESPNALEMKKNTVVYKKTSDQEEPQVEPDTSEENDNTKEEKNNVNWASKVKEIKELTQKDVTQEQFKNSLMSALDDLSIISNASMDIKKEKESNHLRLKDKEILEQLKAIDAAQKALKKSEFGLEKMSLEELKIDITSLSEKPQTSIQISRESIGKLQEAQMNIRIQDKKKDLLVPVENIDIREQKSNSPIIIVIQSQKNFGKEVIKEKSPYQKQRLIGEGFQWQVEGIAEDSLDQKGEVQWSYKDKKNEVKDPNKLGIYVYDSHTEQWKYVGGVLDKENHNITFKSSSNEIYALMEYDRTFRDIQGHWAKTVIEEMASKHIVQGVNEEDFDPDKKITRAEFVSLLVRILGLEEETHTCDFKDIGEQDWYASSLQAAVKAGLVTGYDGYFRPYDFITREEMSVLLVKGYEHMVSKEKWALEVENPIFEDMKEVSSWAKPYMEQAVQLTLLQGVSQGRLAPQEQGTRAQAVMMLKRMLDKND